MSLTKHRSCSDVARFGFFDGAPHDFFRHDIAKPPVTVDNRGSWRVRHDIHGCTRNDMALVDAVDVRRDLNNAVTIVPGQIRAHAMPSHGLRFGA